MTFLLCRKTGLRATKKVLDFFKLLPATAPFPHFVGEKIFNKKASIKKIKSIGGRLLDHF
jgi:hypothetical protein